MDGWLDQCLNFIICNHCSFLDRSKDWTLQELHQGVILKNILSTSWQHICILGGPMPLYCSSSQIVDMLIIYLIFDMPLCHRLDSEHSSALDCSLSSRCPRGICHVKVLIWASSLWESLYYFHILMQYCGLLSGVGPLNQILSDRQCWGLSNVAANVCIQELCWTNLLRPFKCQMWHKGSQIFSLLWYRKHLLKTIQQMCPSWHLGIKRFLSPTWHPPHPLPNWMTKVRTHWPQAQKTPSQKFIKQD